MLAQCEVEHRIVVQQNLQMLGLRANLDKQTTQNNLNNMKMTRLNGNEWGEKVWVGQLEFQSRSVDPLFNIHKRRLTEFH